MRLGTAEIKVIAAMREQEIIEYLKLHESELDFEDTVEKAKGAHTVALAEKNHEEAQRITDFIEMVMMFVTA